MEKVVVLSDEAKDEVSKLQDRIHEARSGRMNQIGDEAATKVRAAQYDWAQRNALDDYYYNRRAMEREYVSALNATERIARFLAK